MNFETADEIRKQAIETSFVAWTEAVFASCKPHNNFDGSIDVSVTLGEKKKRRVTIKYDEACAKNYDIVCDPDDLDDVAKVIDDTYVTAMANPKSIPMPEGFLPADVLANLRKLKASSIAPPAAPNGRPSMRPKKERKVNFVRASDVEPQSVDWLWKYYFARGSLSLLFGEKGLGKSQVTDSLIASVTKTGRWPDGTTAPIGNAIILGSENHKSMTSRPRLDAAGADPNRVALLDNVEEDGEATTFSLQQDLAAVKEAMDEMGDVVLVIIDPITSYLGSQLDSHKVTEVRAVLEPLSRFAEDNNIVIILVTHPTKMLQDKSVNMAVGSGAFVHLPRTGFLVMPDPEAEDPRVARQSKVLVARQTRSRGSNGRSI